jgi:CheY-like chemotaxis protein
VKEPPISNAEPKTGDAAPATGDLNAADLGIRRLSRSDFTGLPTSRKKPPPRSRPLILVVDDEPDILFVTRTRIRLSGYDVEEAVDGEIALKRIQELRPDLVLLDLRMPKLNGFELCRTVKADPNLRGISILVCSAFSSLGVGPEQRCLEVGADGYIRKPYSVDKLLQEISRLLVRKKTIEEVVS